MAEEYLPRSTVVDAMTDNRKVQGRKCPVYMLDAQAAQARRVAQSGDKCLPGDERVWFLHGRHLNPNDAAALLEVSVDAVRRWSLFGWVRFVRLDSRSHYLYCEDDVMDLLRLCQGYGKPSAALIQRRIKVLVEDRDHLLAQTLPERWQDLKPSVARVVDDLGGGRESYPCDQELAAELRQLAPWVGDAVSARDRFVSRAAWWMAGRGVQRFLHIGCGYPRGRSLREQLQGQHPDVQVVYVEDDVIAAAHCRAILTNPGDPYTAFVRGGLEDVQAVLDSDPVRLLLAAGQPVGVVLPGVLHRLTHDRRALNAVARLRDAVPVGSYLSLTHPQVSPAYLHGGADEEELRAAATLFGRECEPVRLRTREQIGRFFTGWKLQGPQLTSLDKWTAREQGPLPGPALLPILAGVAFKAAPTRTRRERLTYLMDGLRKGANPPANAPTTGRSTT